MARQNKRGRGRPKGSKNKAKTATKQTAPKAKRGRPAGSKNKPKITTGKQEMVSETQSLIEENTKRLVTGEDVVSETVETPKRRGRPAKELTEDETEDRDVTRRCDPCTDVKKFNSYVVDRSGYTIDAMYKKDKSPDYWNATILVRAMCDYEQRAHFYLEASSVKGKNAFKAAIYADLEILKERIKGM
jgi:hypothetical protein